MQPNSQSIEPGQVKVWDPLVRLFHWGLALAFATAWLTEGDELMSIHSLAGYTVLGLILFRLVWGFAGSAYARFADFVRGPGEVLDYLLLMKERRAPRYIGHNPAGGAMVVMLLSCLLATAIAGMLTYGTEGHGPLAGLAAGMNKEMLEGIHELLGNFTLLLVVLHLAGVAYSSWENRENLPRAMVTGLKRAPDGDVPPPGGSMRGGALLTAALSLMLAGLVATVGYVFPEEEEGDRTEQGEHGKAGKPGHGEDEEEERRERSGRR